MKTLTKTNRLAAILPPDNEHKNGNGNGNGATSSRQVTITAPKFEVAELKIVGTAPYVQLRFSQKAKNTIAEAQQDPTKKSKRNRTARDFEADYKAALHVSDEGWNGIPASAFRNAMVRACSIVDFKMTLAKMSVFIEADGYDAQEVIPLVRIVGEPTMHVGHVRNANGSCDLRARAMFKKWGATVRVRYDAGQFNISDVTNLLSRAGEQVGIGEGRPSSPNSPGVSWGLFKIVNK